VYSTKSDKVYSLLETGILRSEQYRYPKSSGLNNVVDTNPIKAEALVVPTAEEVSDSI